jgi:ubiquinone biosynthesis protein
MPFRTVGMIGRTYRHLRRYRQILVVFLKYGFGDLLRSIGVHGYAGARWWKIGAGRPEPVGVLSRAEAVKAALEELGPTFIKAGQFLSTRPDLLPAEFIEELAKLQDDVPPFSFSDARQIIEQELGSSLEQVFSDFQERPVAAASIGQVHAARLPDGNEVVVKIQRPGLRATVRVDMEIMTHLAALAEKHLAGGEIYQPALIVQELARSLERELDYNLEAANVERFAAQFAGDSTVYVPTVYRDLTTKRVLTMERVHGVKASEIDQLEEDGLDGRKVASRGFDQIMRQIFVYGFFHGDPHPGNILVLPDNVICYLDFGMMGRVSRQDRECFVDLLAAIARRDEVKAAAALLRIATPQGALDYRVLERELGEIMDDYSPRALKELDFAGLLQQVMRMIVRHRLRVPPDLYLMAKALGSTEGLGRALDPEFNAMERAIPFVRRIQFRRLDPRSITRDILDSGSEFLRLLREIPGEVREILTQARQGRVKFEFEHRGLEPMLSTHDRISNRIAFSIVLGSLVVGSALVILSGVPPLWCDIPVIGLAGFLVAGVMGFWLLVSILRGGKM